MRIFESYESRIKGCGFYGERVTVEKIGCTSQRRGFAPFDLGFSLPHDQEPRACGNRIAFSPQPPSREAHGYMDTYGYLHLGSIADTGYFGYLSITHTVVCVILALGWYPQYRSVSRMQCHPGPPAHCLITFVCTLS